MNTFAMITDPHGIIMTVVSVSVVFAALLCLYLAYALIGRIVNYRAGQEEKKEDTPTAEEAAAIGMALHMYFDETVHDQESYRITIKRRR